jgi:hypothetical protein
MCKRKYKTDLALKNLQFVYGNPPNKQFFINLYDSIQLFVNKYEWAVYLGVETNVEKDINENKFQN